MQGVLPSRKSASLRRAERLTQRCAIIQSEFRDGIRGVKLGGAGTDAATLAIWRFVRPCSTACTTGRSAGVRRLSCGGRPRRFVRLMSES